MMVAVVWLKVPPHYPTPPTTSGSVTVYVDAAASAAGDGSKTKPYSSVAAAVEAAGGGETHAGSTTKNVTIVLRAGVYYEKQMLLTTNHSGLTIQNFEGERVSSKYFARWCLSNKWDRPSFLPPFLLLPSRSPCTTVYYYSEQRHW